MIDINGNVFNLSLGAMFVTLIVGCMYLTLHCYWKERRGLCVPLSYGVTTDKNLVCPFYPAPKIWTRMFYFNLCTQISGCKFNFCFI